MDRRSFLRASALSGLAFSAPWVFPSALRSAAAQAVTYGGPYWIIVHASGAWDPLFLFNPTENTEHNRLYTGVGKSGSIPYAPYALNLEQLQWGAGLGIEGHVRTPQQFLARHGARLTVVNGIDTETNNHKGGVRTMACGQLPVGYPALAALIAATHAPQMPMTFFSGGGYDVTGGLVPLTRVANAQALSRIAYPNEVSAGQVETELYHSQATMARIQRYQQERVASLHERQRLPALRKSMEALVAARASTAVLDQLSLPEELVTLAPNELNAQEGFMQSAQMLVAAFGSGLTSAGTIQMGGFDTHGNHDVNQTRRIVQLLGGLDYLIDEVERAGLTDKVNIVVTSDFGRGPHYNSTGANGGKDHWPVTSMFALGPGVAGDRCIGGTDERELAVAVDPTTLELSDGGVTIGPGEVHRALRTLAGVDAALDAAYPLSAADLPLFG